MSRFVQGHLLTAYPPSNPNRDDLGRPKTAVIGGQPRMRISSQAIKRAIRTADTFRDALAGSLGERTQRIGDVVQNALLDEGATPAKALEIASQVAMAFGKVKDGTKSARTEQLAFVSPQEKERAIELGRRALAGEALPSDKELARAILLRADTAVDVGMFGRMLAATPEFNRDAAVQVAHGFTVNRVDIEDDYYTAVDDLKTTEEDGGAGFVGEAGFGSGVFYLYFCIDREQLVRNLDGDTELAEKGISAFIEAAATVSPSGKRNSFANHVRSEYFLVEKGDRQPVNLFSAFLKPVTESDQVNAAIRLLEEKRKAFAESYGVDAPESLTMKLGSNQVVLADLCRFASSDLGDLRSKGEGK